MQLRHTLLPQLWFWDETSSTLELRRLVLLCRGPRAGEVQRASAALVKKWGKQKGALAVKEEQRESERFFSQTFEPLMRSTEALQARET